MIKKNDTNEERPILKAKTAKPIFLFPDPDIPSTQNLPIQPIKKLSSNLKKRQPLFATNIIQFQKDLLHSMQTQNLKVSREEKEGVDVEEIYNNIGKDYYKLEDNDQESKLNKNNNLYKALTHKTDDDNMNNVIAHLSRSIKGRKPQFDLSGNPYFKRLTTKYSLHTHNFLSCILIIRWTQRLRIRILKYGSTERNPKIIVKNEEILFSARTFTKFNQIEKKWYIISPDFILVEIWKAFIYILSIYIGTGYLYRICCSKNVVNFIAFDYIVETLFLIDIVLHFFRGYYNEEGVLVISFSEIFKNYLQTSLIVDIISMFPFYLFKVSRFIYLINTIKIYRLFSPSSYPSLMKKFMGNSHSLKKILGFIFLSFFICHVFACLWFLLAICEYSHHSWIIRYGYFDYGNFSIYLKSLYFSFAMFITVGYGDITAYAQTEIIIISFWLVFCGIYYSFNLSTLGSLFSNENEKNFKKHNLMQSIKVFAKKNCLNSDLTTKLKENIENNSEILLRENASANENSNEFSLILNELNVDLKYRIVLDFLDGRVKDIDLFSNCKKEFIANLVPLLEPKSYKFNQVIYKTNIPPENIYFIIEGKVSLVTEDNIPFSTLRDGNYFGEIEILKKTYRMMGAKSKSNHSLLLTMNKNLLTQEFVYLENHFFLTLIGRMIRRYNRFYRLKKTISSIIKFGKQTALLRKQSLTLNKEGDNIKLFLFNLGIRELIKSKKGTEDIKPEEILFLSQSMENDNPNDEFDLDKNELENAKIFGNKIKFEFQNVSTRTVDILNIEGKSSKKFKTQSKSYQIPGRKEKKKLIKEHIQKYIKENKILKEKINIKYNFH